MFSIKIYKCIRNIRPGLSELNHKHIPKFSEEFLDTHGSNARSTLTYAENMSEDHDPAKKLYGDFHILIWMAPF